MADLRLILVHGTFAKADGWPAENSRFRRELAAALGGLDVEMHAFAWSGWFGTRLNNGHRYRLAAGRQLAELLSQPSARCQIVVAHSHGGNVARYALRDDEARAKVAGLVCMGTPFLRVERRDLDTSLKEAGLFAFCAFALTFLAVLLPVMLLAGEHVFDVVRWYLETVTAVGHWLKPQAKALSSVFLLVSLVAPLALGVQAGRWYWDFLETRVPAWLLRRQERLFAELTLPPHGIRQMVLATEADEAQGWLRRLGGVSEAPFLAWAQRHWMTVAIYLWLLLSPVGHEWLRDFAEDEPGWPWWTFKILFAVVIFPPLFSAFLQLLFLLPLSLWPRLFRAHQAGFGQESILHNVLLRVQTTARPPEPHDYYTYRFRGGLHHSAFYADAQAVEDIAAWIRRVAGD